MTDRRRFGGGSEVHPDASAFDRSDCASAVTRIRFSDFCGQDPLCNYRTRKYLVQELNVSDAAVLAWYRNWSVPRSLLWKKHWRRVQRLSLLLRRCSRVGGSPSGANGRERETLRVRPDGISTPPRDRRSMCRIRGLQDSTSPLKRSM